MCEEEIAPLEHNVRVGYLVFATYNGNKKMVATLVDASSMLQRFLRIRNYCKRDFYSNLKVLSGLL
jgi:hypothetical protein